MLLRTTIESPLGELIALFTQEGILLLQFSKLIHTERMVAQCELHVGEQSITGENEHSLNLRHQLTAYFSGELHHFNLPIVNWGTAFQQRVWHALMQIPYGSSWTYKAQAELLGTPKAVRAVANANRQNRIVIVIPCHRVIGSNGKLVGYAGELWRKDFLLRHEETML